MEIQVAVAKVDKFSSDLGGDTAEIIERPNGGFSIVMADGKLNGIISKNISLKIVHRTINLISEGIHDGAACKSVAKSLFNEFSGRVSASLNILSCDMETNSIVITRCSPLPVTVIQGDKINSLKSDCGLLGENEDACFSVYQIPLENHITIIMATDGIASAGESNHNMIHIPTILSALYQDQEPSAKETADFLLKQAVNLDQNKPADDMCVVVLQTVPHLKSNIRKLSLQFPIR